MNDVTYRATAARWTPAGRGAIAAIRVCNAAPGWNETATPLFLAANGNPWATQPLNRPLAGRWGREAPEDVVVCRLSETGFEVQCHGGDVAVRRILQDLAATGIATINVDEQVASLREDIEREVQIALMHAPTWRTANWLLEQVRLWRDYRLVSSDAAYQILERTAFGLHLSKPWSVVLTGRPNVGKSSLINALLGFRRAIVAEQPGTTRDVVTGVTAFDGWPVELADTAGQRTADAALEAAGIELARAKLAAADLRIILLDQSEPPHPDDAALLQAWPDALIVAHKADLSDRWGTRMPAGARRASSLTGGGLDGLMTAIVERLVPREPPSGMLVPVSLRHVEWLRTLKSGPLSPVCGGEG